MKVINSVFLLSFLLVFCSNISGFLMLEDKKEPKHIDEIESYNGSYQTIYHPCVYLDMDEVRQEQNRKSSLLIKILKSKPMIPLLLSLFIGSAFKNSFSCFVAKLGVKNSVVALVLEKFGFENAKKFFDVKFKCPGD